MASSRNDGFSEPDRVSIWRRLVDFVVGTGSNQGTQPTLENVTEEKDEQGINGEQKAEEDHLNRDVEHEKQSMQLQTENCEKLKERPRIEREVRRRRRRRLEGEVGRFNQNKQQVKEENDNLKKNKQRLQEENIELATKIQRLRDENIDLTTKMERLQEENIDLTSRMQRLQDENVDVTTQMQRLKDENIDLTSRMQRLEEENEDIKNENSNFKTINELLREDNRSIQLTNLGAIMHLQRDGLEFFEKTKQLQQENSNLSIEVEELKQEKRRMATHIQQMQQEESKMHNQIQQLRREKSQMDNENQQLQEENTKKNNEIRRYEEDKNNMSNEIQQLQEENDDMSNEIQELRQENSNMKIEIQQLQEHTMSSFITESGSVVVLNEELGRGGYGVVHTGDFHGTKVAVKEYYAIILSQHNLQVLQREINIAAQCRHPNLLQFICATKNDQNHLLIVTEVMDMNLRTLIKQREKSRLEDQEVKSISLDVARGLNYLHSRKPSPIIHRDVSSANVLLWIENGAVRRAKISDYGSANFMQVCNTPNPGAALYAAPEASRAQHDPKIDVFSYGLLVCETSIGQLPHSEQVRRRGQINRIPNHGIKELVRRCTELDPRRRPTMQGVIESLQQVE